MSSYPVGSHNFKGGNSPFSDNDEGCHKCGDALEHKYDGDGGFDEVHECSATYQCPFCGGFELDENVWNINDAEIDALECRSCLAGAPYDAWVKHAKKASDVGDDNI